MAIRKREGRAKPWQCYWNNPITGKRESESFETKEEALKQDSLIKHRLKFERESFRQEEAAEEKSEITLEQAYVAYLREKQFNKRSLANQLSNMRPMLRIFGKMQIDMITKAMLADAIDEQIRKAKPATVRTIFGRLFTLLRWSASKGLCERIDLPRLPSPDYKSFIPPTPSELARIMEVAPPHLQRVIILGAQMGARVGPSELFILTWQDVDLVQAIIRVHGSKKNAKSPWREVPIRENLIPVLAQWACDDKKQDISHIIHYHGKAVQSIKTTWAKTLRKAGIERRIRPYDLRHAFATELIAAGADIGTVAKLMGHSSSTMILEHYQYVMDKQKRAAIECLPDLNYVPNPCAQKIKGRS